MDSGDILKNLDQVLQARKLAAPDASYVASLYAKGTSGIIAKILEEAQELTETDGKREQLVHETADLWFHCLVFLAYHNIDSAAVLNELAKRFGISGHLEKKNRN